MNLFSMMDISSSALRAERVRAEVTATNMANAETTRTAEGGPYLRKSVLFSGDPSPSGFSNSLLHARLSPMSSMGSTSMDVPGGVNIAGVVSNEDAVVRRYDPGHPDADKDGYVTYPDINPLTEMVDLMGATRAYGLNVTAVQAEKGMLTASLDILK
ncbi:MAG: flagellar basal body rod protein FlgC [Acidobacteria bacterium]|nr:flagellar basal body rod protein FlgC [Acidobacteriota bacterium]